MLVLAGNGEHLRLVRVGRRGQGAGVKDLGGPRAPRRDPFQAAGSPVLKTIL